MQIDRGPPALCCTFGRVDLVEGFISPPTLCSLRSDYPHLDVLYSRSFQLTCQWSIG